MSVFDSDPAMRSAAVQRVGLRLQQLADAGLLDEDPSVVLARLDVADELAEAVPGCALVQESIVESLEAKRRLFEEIDRIADPTTILASSTSMIPCSRWAATLKGRARCVVVHPGNPPYLLPIAEVVPAPFTNPTVVDTVTDIFTSVGMTPVVVEGEPEGFVFNRLQGALLREAYCLVRDGVVDPASVDLVVSLGLGRRWAIHGPFATAQLNTRGGIRRHADLMGPAYQRMGEQRGQNDPWTADLVDVVAEATDRALPPGEWEQQNADRTAALIALERARRSAPDVF